VGEPGPTVGRSSFPRFESRLSSLVISLLRVNSAGSL
jgi:hypothetical protein